ncbi:MAG: hypothetical protein IKS31_05120 [Clostridia bacterium]|nr:hypothetical protein [Clostridia bacterium]
MLLAIILLLYTVLIVRKNPTKFKRILFRLIAAFTLIMCVAVIISSIPGLLWDPAKPTPVTFKLVETDDSGVLTEGAADTITVTADEPGPEAQADEEAAKKAADIESANRTNLVEASVGLIITVVSIVLFRKFYHASSLYVPKQKPTAEELKAMNEERKAKKGNGWRIPLFLLGILGGMALGIYDITEGIGIHRAVYYVLAIVLLVVFVKTSGRFNLVDAKRQPLRLRILDGILIIVFCSSVALSACSLANQYVIAKRVGEEQAHRQALEHQRRMNTESVIKTTLTHPDNATFTWDSDGKGVTVKAPNSFGVYSTLHYNVSGN